MKQQGISAAMAGHARHKPVPAHLEILQPMTGRVNLVSEYLAASLQASYEPYETEVNKKKRQRKVMHSIARPMLTQLVHHSQRKLLQELTEKAEGPSRQRRKSMASQEPAGRLSMNPGEGRKQAGAEEGQPVPARLYQSSAFWRSADLRTVCSFGVYQCPPLACAHHNDLALSRVLMSALFPHLQGADMCSSCAS